MAHIREAASRRQTHHNSQWIRSLLSRGLAPKMAVLFAVPVGMRWQVAEKFFIASSKAFGFDLTNTHEGGGCDQVQTVDQAKTRSERARGTWLDPEIREKRVTALQHAHGSSRGREAKREAANRPGTKAKKADALRAHYASVQAKAESSERWKAVWSRPGMAEKKAAATKAAWADPEAAERRRAAISEGKRIGWARKKAALAAAKVNR